MADLHAWVQNIVDYYREHDDIPDAVASHYGDGGLAAAIFQEAVRVPFTFTAHSLGAIKLDRLLEEDWNFGHLLQRFRFDKRIAGERVAMARAARIITSTRQEQREQYGHPAYRGVVDPDQNEKYKIPNRT